LGIEAGWGIKAGLSITCKRRLSVALRVFAGLCLWKLPSREEMEIRCGKLESGTISFGTLVEAGLPEDVDAGVSQSIEVIPHEDLNQLMWSSVVTLEG
jgi:hypothetical protein